VQRRRRSDGLQQQQQYARGWAGAWVLNTITGYTGDKNGSLV